MVSKKYEWRVERVTSNKYAIYFITEIGCENGTMAVVLPHGVLFRGAAEGHIRQYLIKDKNYLDAVIGLPANIYYGTSIPTCILVLKKDRNKDNERSRSVLFIDASHHFEKVKTQNVLRKEDIDKIITTYRNYSMAEALEAGEFEDKYAYVATLTELAENDYNLNIPRYVDTFEEEAAIDLNAVALELRQLDKEIENTDSTITAFCKELGIETPF
jgi:type I restriction enzyme M protein